MNFKKIIFGNWKIKLVAFAVALGLWFYATANQSTFTNFPGKIPVKTENLIGGTVAILDNEFVEIKISADTASLPQIKEDNFSATVDLNGLNEGTYNREINVSSKNSAVRVVAVNPNKTTVRIEKKVTKTVPIRARFDGSVAEEFVVSDSNPDPPEAQVSGPESAINTISEAVAPIKLSGETENFEKTAQLFVYTASGREIKNVEINPQNILIKITVSRAGQTKTVGIKVKLQGSVADGCWISSIKTNPEVVTLNGTRAGVASTNFLETEPVDISGVNSNKTVNARLVVPAGLSIGDKTSSIQVTIEVKKFETIKDVYITPKFLNLAGDLYLKNYNPKQVKLTIGGTQDAINSLGQDAIAVNLDLSGLGDGNHNFDITRDNITTPNNIDLVSIGDGKSNITLSKK